MNLKDFQDKTILLLGKSRAFDEEEFSSFIKNNHITVVKEFCGDIALIVEGRMMNPYEQNTLEELYAQKKYEFASIDDLESALAKEIDGDTLLMSLKLSRNKERLKSFLQNSMITNELFFRLLTMYDWKREDFFENDDNRDVSAAFISRFYENIERNHNVQYATTGFIHLVAQAKDSTLLKAIASLEPLAYHPKIKAAIAMNKETDEELQKRFYKSNDEKILEALSMNENLSIELVHEFLKDIRLGRNVAKSIKLTDELFDLLHTNIIDLATNETLTLAMQNKLLELKDKTVNLTLAKNNKIDASIIETLLKEENQLVNLALYENNSTPKHILQEAYNNPLNHEALAKNENTPVEILYQLQLDSRYDRFVKTNAGYGKYIQTENLGWLV